MTGVVPGTPLYYKIGYLEVSDGVQTSEDEPFREPAEFSPGSPGEAQESALAPHAWRLASVIHDQGDAVAAIAVAIAFVAGAGFVLLLLRG